jgi:hypothetical protein
MSHKTKALLITATAFSLFAGAQAAQAHHLRFLRFPHIFSQPAPDYGYDNYDDSYPAYEGDAAYADQGYVDDYADPYYVPRRHKRKPRIVDSSADPWWLDAPQPRRLKSTRSLEPVPYHKPRVKTASAVTPVSKLAPTSVRRKVAPLALAPEAKPVIVKPAKPKVVTASLTPAKPQSVKTIGCTAGAAIVTGYGFASVTPKVCTGNVYAYSALRDGKPYVIKVTAAQGEITEVTKQ